MLIGVGAAALAVAARVARRDPGAARDARPPRPVRLPVPVLLAAVVLGMLLRLPWTDAGPMDHLEYALTYEVEYAESLRELVWNRIGIEQAHQPLSRLPIWAALQLGLEATAARWAALACWLGALVVAARVVPRLAGWAGLDGTEGRLAAGASLFAVAVSPLGVRYGFDATPYGLLALACWAATLGVARILEGGRAAIAWAPLAAAVGFYANYSALPCFAGILLAGVWIAGDLPEPARTVRRARLVAAGALFGLAVVPWIPGVLAAVPLFDAYVAREAELYAMDFPPLDQAMAMARITSGLPAALALVVLVGAPLAALVAGAPPARRTVLALAFPTLAFSAFKLYQLHRYAEASGGTYFGARHFMPCLLFVLPGAVLALAALLRGRVPAPALRVALLVLPIAGGLAALDLWRQPWRPEVRAATAHVREHLESGDAVGVLPRFFYSQGMLVELTQGRMRYGLGAGWGFVEFPVAPAAGGEAPIVWLVADDREYPLPAALENFAFERVWVLDFREEEFGIPELAPAVSDRVTEHMDARHELLERRHYAQLTLSLYRLRYDLEPWDGSPYEIREDSWRDRPRQTSWTMPHGDRGLVYRYDLPAPRAEQDVTVTLVFGPSEEDDPRAFDAEVVIDPVLRRTVTVPPEGGRIPLALTARPDRPLVVEIEFRDGMRIPEIVRMERREAGAG